MRKLKLAGMLMAVLALLSARAVAMERFDIVTTQELKQMLALRASGQADFLLVNALDELIFNDSAIPGSINVPWCRAEQTVGRLGENKSRLIVTY